VMHDDQHGTAIISAAALLNALEIVDKKIEDVKIVVSGAGASSISCNKLYISLGAKRENIFMFDSKGLIHPDRTDLNGKKPEFVNGNLARETSLVDALVGADVFVGLSKGNLLKGDDIKGMAKDPIVFAMANPTPEISFEEATTAREDVIMATGRSDYPNQVNNVLGFPYIFRGALDVKSSFINEEMKIAAVYALAKLAKEPVPDMVNMAYGDANLKFGRNYIIPKPVDPRLITEVAPAVAKAAMDSGVAKHPITDWEAYEFELSSRLGLDNTLTKVIETKAKQAPKRVVFADAGNLSVLKAAQVVYDEGIAFPILLGNVEKVSSLISEYNIDIPNVRIVDPSIAANDSEAAKLESYGKAFFEKRKRKGQTLQEGLSMLRKRNYYGAMMVDQGDADAMIGGLTRKYPDTVRPALQIIGPREGVKKVATMHIMMTRFGPIFLADTTINHHLNSDDIADIAELVAHQVKKFNIEPKIALVTYSNFGSVPHGESAVLMRKATEILHRRHPEWIVDGEMQAHMPFSGDLMTKMHPFSKLAGQNANILIFPNLSSANIAYNLLHEMANIDMIGPVMLGLDKPVHILQLGATVREIVDMVALAVLDAQG